MNINSDFVQRATDRMAEICDFMQASIPLPLIGFERQPVRRISEDGFEALGSYNSETHTIRLYPKSIEQCALDLKIDAQTICDIVVAHEIAHLVTHKGKSPHQCAKEWREFEKASRDDKEWAAQSMTFQVLLKQPEMIAAFKALSKECPKFYQTWDESADAVSFAYDLYQRSGRAVDKGCLIDHDE